MVRLGRNILDLAIEQAVSITTQNHSVGFPNALRSLGAAWLVANWNDRNHRI